MKTILVLVTSLLSVTAFSQLFEMPIYSVTSLQPGQSGQEVAQCIDNDNASLYHSQWGQSGIPDELNFYFSSQVESIKKIVYTPRQSGTNGIWTDVTVSYSTQSNPSNFTTIQSNLIWAQNSLDKEIDLATAIQNPYAIKFEIHAAGGNFSSCAEMNFYSETDITVFDGTDCAIATSSLIVNGANDVEVAIVPAGTTASSFQGGENIDKSYDNNTATLYHSAYGNTQFPVNLNYRFDGTTPIDYLKYIPRTSGNNGFFGEVTITYNTLGNSTFQPLVTFDFDQLGLPVMVPFPSQITPLNINISVADGYGNYASCAEMEFYTAGASSSSNAYMNVFADNLHSTLLPSITQLHIDTISSPFYKELAQCIFDGSYVSQYRVQSYEVYPTVSSVSSELKIGTYDNFENATGIAFTSGEKVAVFAENVPANAPVYLSIKDFQTGFGGTVSHYALQNGLNVFTITNDGMGYISYFNSNESLNDVDINIVSGKINGYYERGTTSSTEWLDLLTNSAYPYIDVVGEFAHLVYPKTALAAGSPFDALPLIGKYDTIVQHEHMMMGLFKFNRAVKNHMLTYCEYGGGYYAGGLGVHLDLGWGVPALTDPEQIGIWGIAHEYGHINQIRPALKWIGTTEVTNNIYSIWVDHHLDNGTTHYTRLEDENVTPAAGIPSITGGRVNGAIYQTLINQLALQDTINYDVFKILVPFWQLNIYYSLAGASRNEPTLTFSNTNGTGVDYAHWFGKVAEVARTTSQSGVTNGQRAMNFVKNTCDAVEENLIPFFRNAGFLTPIDVPINDYGLGQLTITQQMIDDVIAYVESKNYNDPISPVIHYASDHSIDMYKNLQALSGITGTGSSLSGNYLTVDHAEWHNAVAYETFDAAGELIYVSISGSGDPTNQQTKVYYPSNALAVYAVGFDGQKILVFPADLSVEENNAFSGISIYPNPVCEGNPIHLSSNDSSSHFSATIVSIEGKTMLKAEGTIADIESAINRQLAQFERGTYILSMTGNDGNLKRVKFVKG